MGGANRGQQVQSGSGSGSPYEASGGTLNIRVSNESRDFAYTIAGNTAGFEWNFNIAKASGVLTNTLTHDIGAIGSYGITAARSNRPKPPMNADAGATGYSSPVIGRFDVVDWGADFKYSYKTPEKEFCMELKAEAHNGGHNLTVCSKYCTGGIVYKEESMICTFQKRFTINSAAHGEYDLSIERECKAKFTMVASDAECSLNIDTPLGKHNKKAPYGTECTVEVKGD